MNAVLKPPWFAENVRNRIFGTDPVCMSRSHFSFVIFEMLNKADRIPWITAIFGGVIHCTPFYLIISCDKLKYILCKQLKVTLNINPVSKQLGRR